MSQLVALELGERDLSSSSEPMRGGTVCTLLHPSDPPQGRGTHTHTDDWRHRLCLDCAQQAFFLIQRLQTSKGAEKEG